MNRVLILNLMMSKGKSTDKVKEQITKLQQAIYKYQAEIDQIKSRPDFLGESYLRDSLKLND
jgi:N-dimethylarginine dimethylaminohydrolase